MQRQEEEEEEEIQMKSLSEQITPIVQRQVEEEEEEEPLMTKSISGRSQQIRDDLHIRLNRNGGQPLPEADRSSMERRFGADFSGVRVHTDSDAIQMNKELNAQAFTHGRDIYFGAGRYNPGTLSGKRLLAHELTHVVQQSSGCLRFNGDQKNQNLRLREKLIKTKPNSGAIGLVIQRRFINRGRTATDRVHWAGGTGATGFVPGSIQRLIVPIFRGRNPRRPAHVARAWIRPRTGRIRVVRFYIGVRRGDQGGGAGHRWHMTRRAARRTNRHERIHIRTSRNLYRRYLSPLLRLVRRYRGRRRALRYGSTRAEAIARLRTIVGWNTSVNDFRNQDTVFNQPGGTVDRNEPAAGTDLVDCRAGNVGGIHYDHRAMAPNECPP